MGPKAIARAAHWADGVDGAWTMDGDRDAMATAFTQIRGAWEEAGRTEAPHLSSSIWYAIGDDAEARLRDVRAHLHEDHGRRRGRLGGGAVTCFTPDALRRAVDNARDAGADEFFLVPTTSDPDELARTCDALGI